MTQVDTTFSILGDIAKLLSGFWGKGGGLVKVTLQEFTPGLCQPLHLSSWTWHVAVWRWVRGAVKRTVGDDTNWAGTAHVRHTERMARAAWSSVGVSQWTATQSSLSCIREPEGGRWKQAAVSTIRNIRCAFVTPLGCSKLRKSPWQDVLKTRCWGYVCLERNYVNVIVPSHDFL